MLARNFRRKGATTQRDDTEKARLIVFASLLLSVAAFTGSCSTKPTDMRTLVPADALIYLETDDLAAALEPVINSKPFKETTKSKPDLSPVKGVQLAVAVTGFETSEKKVTDESSIGSVRPHFVAIADTHTWNVQAVRFVEQKLGGFVTRMYDNEPTVEVSDKNGGRYFVWTVSNDNGSARKAYALVIDSLVYFGNDESSIDKALAVRGGQADSLINTGKVAPADAAVLARGYISTDGVAQIANLAALQAATVSTEDGELRSAISVVLPQMIRESITDLRWESFRAKDGIEDRFVVSIPAMPVADQKEMLSDLVDSFFEDIESTPAEDVVAVIADRNEATASNTVHRREDHLTATTAERRIVTDLGFIGWIIAQLSEE